jgi:hypothetical protein
VRPTKLLQALAESAAKMPGQMRLIGKTGFGCDIPDRAPCVCREQLLGVLQSTTQKVLVRRQSDYLVPRRELVQSKGRHRFYCH